MAKKDKDAKGKKADKADDAAEEKTGGKGKLIIIIVAALLVVGGGGGGAAFFFLGGDKGAAGQADAGQDATGETVEVPTRVAKGDPRYIDLDPDFTINMDGDSNTRFVQIAVSLLTYFDDTEEAVKENLPIIRNNIILMVGRKSSDELATSQGKDSLQSEIREEVQRVIEENSGDGVMDIDQVFFTKFVMQ